MKDTQKITISLKNLKKLVNECKVSEASELEKTRTFHLGLTSDPEAVRMVDPDNDSGVSPKTIMEDLMGQLSDGMWENSRAMEKWWEFAKVEEEMGETVWVASDTYQTIRGSVSNNQNPYVGLDERKLKEWLANHLKILVQGEVGKQNWKRDNDRKLINFSSGTTVAMVYAVYDILKMRPDRNKNKYYDAFQA